MANPKCGGVAGVAEQSNVVSMIVGIAKKLGVV